ALGDALDDGGDPLGVDLADADVVGHEQRFGTAHHDVVHHHGDQVVADGVVDTHAAGDVDLGAHAVGGGGQQGALEALQGGGVEEAGEAAEAAEDLGALRLLHPLLHQDDRTVARFDVDARGSVTGAAAGRKCLGHGGESFRVVRQGLRAADRVDRGRGGRAGGQFRLQQLLAEELRVGQVHRVLAVEAGTAQVGLGDGGRLDHAVDGDVRQGVGAQGGADLVDRHAVGDEPGAGGEVDAEEAGPLHGRRGDPDVDLGRARLAEHADQGALGVAADDRVVDDDQPLALDHFLERIQLQANTELPDRLRRLDEGASDVGVLHQTGPERNAGRLRVADGGGGAGLRGRYHQVGLGGRFRGEATAHLDARQIDVPAGDVGVRAGQVDVLEDAALGLCFRES